jgi:hypothetical protein
MDGFTPTHEGHWMVPPFANGIWTRKPSHTASKDLASLGDETTLRSFNAEVKPWAGRWQFFGFPRNTGWTLWTLRKSQYKHGIFRSEIRCRKEILSLGRDFVVFKRLEQGELSPEGWKELICGMWNWALLPCASQLKTIHVIAFVPSCI